MTSFFVALLKYLEWKHFARNITYWPVMLSHFSSHPWVHFCSQYLDICWSGSNSCTWGQTKIHSNSTHHGLVQLQLLCLGQNQCVIHQESYLECSTFYENTVINNSLGMATCMEEAKFPSCITDLLLILQQPTNCAPCVGVILAPT
jgi:hypothetical protein